MGETIETIRADLGDRVQNWESRHGRRYYCDIPREGIAGLARELVEKHGLRFITASATDTRASVEILYHFSADGDGAVLSLRVSLPKEKLEVDSLSPFMKSAEWIEREIGEMLGVSFRGHPDPRRLLIADDWPQGNYPLRRDREVQE
jgi:Ni,Fe-hydrogenase III component G